MPTTNQMISRSHVRQGRATISESAEMAPSGATSHTAGVLKGRGRLGSRDRKSTRLNSSHSQIPYAVFSLKKKKKKRHTCRLRYSSLHSATIPRINPPEPKPLHILHLSVSHASYRTCAAPTQQ